MMSVCALHAAGSAGLRCLRFQDSRSLESPLELLVQFSQNQQSHSAAHPVCCCLCNGQDTKRRLPHRPLARKFCCLALQNVARDFEQRQQPDG
jgi:hypothetical protein